MTADFKDVKLSPAMIAAATAAKTGGENRLYRWPGGYWVPRMKKLNETNPEFGHYHGTRTVHGLIARGIFQVVERLGNGIGDPWIVELTDPNQW